ncbi:protein PFC0760c isoform X3 [Aphidius gifuensis]|uniref:protein PFC0760c isoform X3 n=1 Tax=Aphidius gifuensis TaxID=684658 RepID=UPI001CDC977C|nr:protein PFC0760c isoform X3 [Aphidius gifuensis]
MPEETKDQDLTDNNSDKSEEENSRITTIFQRVKMNHDRDSSTVCNEQEIKTLEEARTIIASLRNRIRNQTLQMITWRRTLQTQEVMMAQMVREKVIISRQRRVIRRLQERLAERNKAAKLSSSSDGINNDNDSAVVLDDDDEDDDELTPLRFRSRIFDVTLMRSISDASQPSYRGRKFNGIITNKVGVLETVYSIEEDEDQLADQESSEEPDCSSAPADSLYDEEIGSSSTSQSCSSSVPQLELIQENQQTSIETSFEDINDDSFDNTIYNKTNDHNSNLIEINYNENQVDIMNDKLYDNVLNIETQTLDKIKLSDLNISDTENLLIHDNIKDDSTISSMNNVMHKVVIEPSSIKVDNDDDNIDDNYHKKNLYVYGKEERRNGICDYLFDEASSIKNINHNNDDDDDNYDDADDNEEDDEEIKNETIIQRPRDESQHAQVTYNRVMSNHRSVTKPKDVKYKRINKAKSKSLEELRGRLRTWVDKGAANITVAVVDQSSYA